MSQTLPTNNELLAETARLENIIAAHNRHIESARRLATLLANEAAELTADGIRDLVDEDAEVDAAVQAAIVRQASDRAMHALRRVRELEDLGNALAFGFTTADGQRNYVGRHSVIEDDDVYLIDWRSDAAVPFYRATPSESLGVSHRRHLLYETQAQKQQLVDYSDEIFSDTAELSEVELRGEAALLHAIDSPTKAHMKSVVATIQNEQDQVIRAPAKGALVVQGGPGTGKTVVALHRAAYLLYNYRHDLQDNGVLVVGPTSQFLTYVAKVLPSLGETGVVSSTVERLYSGVLLGHDETHRSSEVKGRLAMASLLANAIKLRQRTPQTSLVVWYGSTKVTIETETLQSLFAVAQRYNAYNEGAAAFARLLVETLVGQAYSPSFDTVQDVRTSFQQAQEVKHFLLKHWPTLTPEQALNDLFGSTAMLRIAAKELPFNDGDLASLHRMRSSEKQLGDRRWSNADAALLDELLYLIEGMLGNQQSERYNRRDALNEFELAALQQDEGVDLSHYETDDATIDPIEPTSFWRSADKNLGLFPVMYDQAETEVD